MASPVRNFAPGEFYHVYNRGNRKQPIFIDTSDYNYWLEKLACNLAKFDCDMVAYCLMSNHYHFLLHQKSALPLTAPMLATGVSYAKRFNKKYDTVGRLFQDRFRARLISSDADLMNVSRYIHLNPQKFTDYENYAWSSIQEYKCGTPIYCNLSPVMSHFASISEYMQFLSDYPRGNPLFTPGVEVEVGV